jgi:hypothetical protein
MNLEMLSKKIWNFLSIKVCALESKEGEFDYPEEVKYKLQTQNEDSYKEPDKINKNSTIISVFFSEFGLLAAIMAISVPPKINISSCNHNFCTRYYQILIEIIKCST